MCIRDRCNRLGIPCGVYWFSYAYTEELAHNEAKYCLEAIAPYKVDYPVAYDFEYDSVDNAEKLGIEITKEMASSFARAFLGEIEAARYYAMLYTCLLYTSWRGGCPYKTLADLTQ